MKTQIKVLAAAGLIAAFAGSSHAFTSVQTEQVTAVTTTGGTQQVAFNLAIRDVTAPAGADQPLITWASPDPVNGWAVADELIFLDYTITNPNGAIQIYTDNTDAPGTVTQPSFVDPTPAISTNTDSNPAGLLWANGNPTTSNTLPMAWSIQAAPATLNAADPNAATPDSFQWLFMLDEATPAIDFDGDTVVDTAAFSDGDPFVTMVRAGDNGPEIHFGQGPTEFGADPDGESYVYFQADFTTAFPQEDYRTDTLTVEAFTQ